MDILPDVDLTTLALRNGTTLINHPFEFAKTLMQFGYEPFPPVESHFLRTTYMAFPNTFQYINYIRTVDGFFGLYRGILPNLFSASVSFIVSKSVAAASPFSKERNTSTANIEEEENLLRNRASGGFKRQIFTSSAGAMSRQFRSRSRRRDRKADLKQFSKETGWQIVSVTAGTIVSYPFRVITVRMMAEFVGRETRHCSVLSSITEIYATEGILGFFRGLVPRLISDVVTVVICAGIVYVVTRNVLSLGNSPDPDENDGQTDESILGGVTADGAVFLGSFIASTFAYQFQVVSNNMIVNNSGLLIGKTPFTQPYKTWMDAWYALHEAKQLSRGSSLFARHYNGPTVEFGGHKSPAMFGQQFGPLHPPGLGFQEKSGKKY